MSRLVAISLTVIACLSMPEQNVLASTIGTTTEDLKVLAEGNNAMAQRVLGKRYALGIEGVAQDFGQAAFWLQKAADKGDAEAQYYLGHLYRQGLGVSQDWVQAYAWFSLAETSKKGAMKSKKLAETSRKIAETNMTAKQIEEAQALASEWLTKHR